MVELVAPDVVAPEVEVVWFTVPEVEVVGFTVVPEVEVPCVPVPVLPEVEETETVAVPDVLVVWLPPVEVLVEPLVLPTVPVLLPTNPTQLPELGTQMLWVVSHGAAEGQSALLWQLSRQYPLPPPSGCSE